MVTCGRIWWWKTHPWDPSTNPWDPGFSWREITFVKKTLHAYLQTQSRWRETSETVSYCTVWTWPPQGTWKENSTGFCDSLSSPVLRTLKGAGEGQPALRTQIAWQLFLKQETFPWSSVRWLLDIPFVTWDMIPSFPSWQTSLSSLGEGPLLRIGLLLTPHSKTFMSLKNPQEDPADTYTAELFF